MSPELILLYLDHDVHKPVLSLSKGDWPANCVGEATLLLLL